MVTGVQEVATRLAGTMSRPVNISATIVLSTITAGEYRLLEAI